MKVRIEHRDFGIAPWLVSAAMLAFGIALLVKPHMTTNLILNIVGIALLAGGGVLAIWYFVTGRDNPIGDTRLGAGIIMACLGLGIMMFKRMLVSFVPFIFGAFLLISGIVKIQAAANMRRMASTRWWLSLIGAGISVLMGMLIVINPFGSALLLTRIIGGTIAFEAIQDLIAAKSYDRVVKTHFVD